MIFTPKVGHRAAFDRDYPNGQVGYQTGNAALYRHESENGSVAGLRQIPPEIDVHLQRPLRGSSGDNATPRRLITGHERSMDIETNYPSIRIVSPAGFDPGTAQTRGSARLAAVAPQLGIQSALWGGLFEVKPGVRTGIHHHGEQQTIAYVLSGLCEVRWGPKGEYAARAKAGDFIHVPAFLPHMEINLSDSASFHWAVVRSTSTPLVVNLPNDTWPEARHALAAGASIALPHEQRPSGHRKSRELS